MSESPNHKVQPWTSFELDEADRTIARPPFDDDTQIVRYVRLSTLLLHFSGRAFLPSLFSLRKLDDLEGQLAIETGFTELRRHFDSLIKPFAPAPHEFPPMVTGQLREAMEFADRCQWWFKELAKRRAVWCWNLFDGHSEAMWRLYGSKGVLIHSSVGRVKRALARAGRFRGLLSPVQYGFPKLLPETIQTFQRQQRETWPFWYLRPYLLKHPRFRYEQELRFVFGIHPSLEKGISIAVDQQELIHTISVSPDIPKDESNLILDLVHLQKPLELRYPAHCDTEWKTEYSKIGGTAFTQKDKPEGLFRDLE
jgi:hypothetical protein